MRRELGRLDKTPAYVANSRRRNPVRTLRRETKLGSEAAWLHIPPVLSHLVRTRRYVGLSPSRSAPERHRQLVMPFAEHFGSDRADCEGAGMHLRPLRPLCANLSSFHHPVLSYPLGKLSCGRPRMRSRHTNYSPRLPFTAIWGFELVTVEVRRAGNVRPR
jgi:hypothetical protein